MKAEHLKLAYGEKIIFDDFSMNFPDKCCITAPSGRGKTSLLMIIARLLEPDFGQIVNGPEKPSFVFQENRLLPWLNVIDNIAIVTDDKAFAQAMLVAVGLKDEALNFPDKLSGGMQRRVALARALAYRGDLLILDEPFNGMDYELKKSMASLINSLSDNYIAAVHSEEDANLLNAVLINI